MSSRDGLLLVGHGSARYPDASSAMLRHAEALRIGGRFSRIEVAVLNGTPSVGSALARLDAPAIRPDIRVVPFFMEDGWFVRVAVPEALRAATGGRRLSRQIMLCPPIGVHDGMAGIIERQALAYCATHFIASHTAAIVIIGHGSATAPGQTLALHRHAARVAATTLFARVEPACLEEAPFVADALRGLRTHPVIAIGFFANQGAHVRDDLPALIAAEQNARGAAGRPVHTLGPITEDPAVADIILDQAMSEPLTFL
ncbi:MAG TPA: CbiX/SirB N-terminal domain-containing protein [Rhodopila sp.]